MSTAAYIARAKALKAATSDAAAAYLIARAEAETLRERVDAITSRILAADDYRCEFTGKRILSPAEDDCITDDRWAAFHALVCEAITAEFGPEFGDRCPALAAESAMRDAAQDLLEAADAVIPGLSRARRLEDRSKAIDLVMSVACAKGFV